MTMQRVLLLRHAHAEPPMVGEQDRDRSLSATGHAEATAAGAWLAVHVPVIDRVLVSPARRTQQTWESVAAQVDARQVETVPAIYMASSSTLERVIAEYRESGETVLLIGHNPGLEDLVLHWAGTQAHGFRGMATAAIAQFVFAADGGVRAVDCWRP